MRARLGWNLSRAHTASHAALPRCSVADGYHLGQLRLPMEKMWPYETDVRIPFFVRGPGIAAGQKLGLLGLNLDIAPTLLALAGIEVPPPSLP